MQLQTPCLKGYNLRKHDNAIAIRTAWNRSRPHRRRNFKFHSVSGRLSSGGYGGSAGTGTIGSTMGSWNNIPHTKAFCREYSVKERKREGRAGREGKVPTFKKIPLIEALHVYTRYEMDPNVASHAYQAPSPNLDFLDFSDSTQKKTSSFGPNHLPLQGSQAFQWGCFCCLSLCQKRFKVFQSQQEKCCSTWFHVFYRVRLRDVWPVQSLILYLFTLISHACLLDLKGPLQEFYSQSSYMMRRRD